MKASEAICNAIVCASIAVWLMRPIARVAAAKTPTSATIITPIGRPSRHRAANSARSGAPRQGEQPQSPHARIDQRGRHKEGEHQRLRQGGGETGADDPERRHAELAEDQRVIGERVERDGDKARDQRRTGALERRKRRARGKEQQARREAPLKAREVDAGVPGDVRRLADGEKELASPRSERSTRRRRRRRAERSAWWVARRSAAGLRLPPILAAAMGDKAATTPIPSRNSG